VTLLVTGATGFLGSAVVRALASNDEKVIAVGGPRSRGCQTIENVEWLLSPYDLEELSQIIEKSPPSAIVHCANHYAFNHRIEDIGPMVDANIKIGATLLGLVAERGAHFINLSTFFQRQGADGESPNSLYAATKQSFVEILNWFGSNTRVRVCDLMLYDTYGPGDQRNKLIPKLLECAVARKTMEIRSPESEINLCYIDDVVAAIHHVLTQKIVGAWSIRSSRNLTVSELVSEVESITNCRIVERYGSVLPNSSPRFGDVGVLPGWKPRTPLTVGLQSCWLLLT
jgi:CDP-paratose synthetase